MKIQITHTENCVVANFEGHRSFYFCDQDLEPFGFQKSIIDCSTLVLLEPWRMTAIHPDQPTRNGQFECRGEVYHMDTQRFLDRLKTLRSKNLKHETSLERFKTKPTDHPLLTVMQMVNHPNANELGKTIAEFGKSLSPEMWIDFKNRMSRYLTMTEMFGHRGEIYFSGRTKAGGPCLGFNGAFILLGKEFSIHT